MLKTKKNLVKQDTKAKRKKVKGRKFAHEIQFKYTS